MDVGSILDRMRAALGFKRDVQLARALGITSGAISQWRSSGKVGADRIIEVAHSAGLSLTWVFDGTGPMLARDVMAADSTATRVDPLLGVLDAMLDSEIVETPEQIATLELRRLRLLTEASIESISRMEAAQSKSSS